MSVTPGNGLVDRERELALLRALPQQTRPALGLVYGRRRVGKTFLLEHSWPGKRVFSFLAANSTAAMNQSEFLRDLRRWNGQSLDPDDYPTWRTVFRFLVELANDEPLIVILDEFQYLLNQADDIASQLVAVWDRDARGRPLTLILSGSEISAMAGLTDGSQPLFGRFNLALKLQPFDYFDAARMLLERPPREAALLFGAFGGLPRYLAAIDTRESVAEAITRLLLAPTGEVALQIEHVIEQERGIRQPAEYRAALAAIAGGATLTSEIAARSGIDDRATKRVLDQLTRLDLVARERNFEAGPKTPWRYLLADNAVRFWYRFAHANRGRLAAGDLQAVWTERVAPLLNDAMGNVFERMSRDAFRRHHTRWGYPAAAEWGRWEGHDRNRRSIEIDIVARLDDRRVLTGEVKWSSQPVGLEIDRHLTRNLEDLANSGVGWARDALDPRRGAGRLYLSAAGFTEEFRQFAAGRDDCRLATLDDLYVASATDPVHPA